MAKLHFQAWCEAWYETELEVPDDLSRKEAFEYAKQHLDEAPLGSLNHLEDSDNLDDCDLDIEGRVHLENTNCDLDSTDRTCMENLMDRRFHEDKGGKKFI